MLKSWAVPKGPSLDPTVRRLAMHVEDHPLEYGDVRGRHPARRVRRGHGRDLGPRHLGPDGRPARGLRKGNLKFTLAGRRLRGGWVLVRMRGQGRSERALAPDQGARRPRRQARAARRPPRPERRRARGRRHKRIGRTRGRARDGPGSRPRARPAALPALRAAAARHARGRGPRGRRLAARDQVRRLPHARRVEGGRVRLLSRERQGLDRPLLRLAAPSRSLPARPRCSTARWWCCGPTARRAFRRCSSGWAADEARGALVYMVFDLLHLDGRDLRGAPLEERKAALEALLAERPADGPVRYSEHVVGGGGAFLAARLRARPRGHGVQASRRALPLRRAARPGSRSSASSGRRW